MAPPRGSRTRRVPVAKQAAAALLAAASAAEAVGSTALVSEVVDGMALRATELALSTELVDEYASSSWQELFFIALVANCLLVFLGLLYLCKRGRTLPGDTWREKATQTEENEAANAAKKTRNVITQSQVTYTSLSRAAAPRFQPLAERETGAWRDGLREA